MSEQFMSQQQYMNALWEYETEDDEGTWWWELSLPRDATMQEITDRYNTLMDSRCRRRNWDDITRAMHAYRDAIAEHRTETEYPS